MKNKEMKTIAVQDIYPDLTILLDAPPEIGLERAKHRGFQDRIEREKIDFHTKVRLGYLKRAEEDKKRFRIIDASQPMEIVQNQLKSILQEKMSMCHDIC